MPLTYLEVAPVHPHGHFRHSRGAHKVEVRRPHAVVLGDRQRLQRAVKLVACMARPTSRLTTTGVSAYSARRPLAHTRGHAPLAACA